MVSLPTIGVASLADRVRCGLAPEYAVNPATQLLRYGLVVVRCHGRALCLRQAYRRASVRATALKPGARVLDALSAAPSQPLVKCNAKFQAVVERALTAHPHNEEALTRNRTIVEANR